MEKAKQLPSGKWRIRLPIPGTTSRERASRVIAQAGRQVPKGAMAGNISWFARRHGRL